jgi:galactose mutarotase-like enzyme
MGTKVSGQQIERLQLKTDTLTAVVLPALGGKIASLQRNGIELLQQPLRPYAPRTLTMGFEESDASGFDECLPSVAACMIDGAQGKTHIPDHGEFWRLPCIVEASSENALKLVSTGTVLPLRFERTLRLDGDSLRIDYLLTNLGAGELPYAWSAHPLFAVDPGDILTLPPSVRRVTVEGSARARLGAAGTTHPWPNATLSDGSQATLNLAGHDGDEIGDKVYAQAPPEGWCILDRKTAGVQLHIAFDPALSPWLGLWLCYGGWPEGQKTRQNCIAIEPCTAPVDSLEAAWKGGFAPVLAPDQSVSWWMTISVGVIS